jgi:hypothetical protein
MPYRLQNGPKGEPVFKALGPTEQALCVRTRPVLGTEKLSQ